MSGQPVADVIIAAKPLLPFCRSSLLTHIFPIVPVVLSSTSSHPVINTSILGAVEVKVSLIIHMN